VKLSVLIPVYNEQGAVQELLERVAAVPVDKEIVVVDDCSGDGTWDVLQDLRLEGLRLLRHERNQGKGAGIRTALAAATGDYVIIQDADLEYDPQDYPKLLQPIVDGQAQVVYGVRNLGEQSWLRRWGNHFLTWATNLIYGSRLRDMETCYKLLPTALARQLQIRANRFDLEPEITAKLLKRGYRIHEVPISYHPRAERKLSPWRDGPPGLWALIKYRFVD
jgi:glycosyltransferase involved in cell wall biosynthesis